MNWEIKDGKIMADGKEQDFATPLWTLVSTGDDLVAERKIIVDERRLPVLRRLGFGREREAALADLRQLTRPERVVLATARKPQVPDQYKSEVAKWLKNAGQQKLAAYLGL